MSRVFMEKNGRKILPNRSGSIPVPESVILIIVCWSNHWVSTLIIPWSGIASIALDNRFRTAIESNCESPCISGITESYFVRTGIDLYWIAFTSCSISLLICIGCFSIRVLGCYYCWESLYSWLSWWLPGLLLVIVKNNNQATRYPLPHLIGWLH